MSTAHDDALGRATRMVVMIGTVSLFADMTYEAGRSISGPFLAFLGAGSVVVATVSGFGELLSHGLRLASGYIAERSGRPWLVMFCGYAVNLLSVPALALVGSWPAAAALLLTERLGKGIRTPARDAVLSHATARLGRGRGFALHEALDQIGAVSGPLVVAAVLAATASYRWSYAILLAPALLALVVITAARRAAPDPTTLEETAPEESHRTDLPRRFWWLVGGSALLAAGFADFPFLAFHFLRADLMEPAMVPILFAAAMAVDGVAALVLGSLFDRRPAAALVAGTVLAVPAVPLALLGGTWQAVIGLAAWSIGLGAQESVLRAAVAEIVPSRRRASAFGIFNGVFGLAWFLGSLAMGLLYQVSIPLLAGLAVTSTILAVPLLARAMRS